MPQPPADSASHSRMAWSHAVPAVLGLAYACAHLAWYRGTALGAGPVVDEQETLAFAEALVRGELPKEPFYRAGGYPLMLALLRLLGVPTTGLFTGALYLGAVLHAINAALVAKIAAVWFGPGSATVPDRSGQLRPRTVAVPAALIAGLLFALNPVMIHYATQALDAVPALTFFLLGLAVIAPEFVARASRPWTALCAANMGETPIPLHGQEARATSEHAPNGQNVPCHRSWRWLVASLAWAAATLCRPNYLLVWCVLVLLAAVLAIRRRAWHLVAAALAGLACFAGYAGWQKSVSGVAGFLPWQGAYNLWAANAPGAHGRYFVQRAEIPPALAHQNPTRLESIYVFRQENGRAPADYRELNAHWRRRFLARITQEPFDWFAQLARKGYALFNDWEQYNNKTYAFHKSRSPWLRWNPLGWGIAFVLGVAGFARLWVETPRAARALGLISAACALSIVLFFVSARFRLPLAALGSVLAGGALAAPMFWRAWSRRGRLLLAGAVAGAAALTFSGFDGVRDRATFIMDHALLARSAFAIGDYRTAATEAQHALVLYPAHRDAMRVAVSAHFNRLVAGEPTSPDDESRWLAVCRRVLETREMGGGELRAIAALALWRNDRRAEALAEWTDLGGVGSAVAARLLAGDRSVTPGDLARAPAPMWGEPLVRLAATQLRLRPPPGVSLPDDPAQAQEIVRQLFQPAGR